MMEQPQEFAIETKGLTKHFGSRKAVEKLNLTVPEGTVFGFLGPNGAGKTTTIRMLLGLIKPTRGTARILGHDCISERAAFLPYVGAIVESPSFYSTFSGYDNLRVLAITGGYENGQRIGEVLEIVGLSERAKDRVKTYSLGMKQRLAIAAALLNNPRIIFLDEPTNGLDPAGTVEVRELIQRLGKLGHTIFISSHLLHEVEQVCTEIAIINRGKLIKQGPVSSLLNQDSTLLIEARPLSVVQQVAANFHRTFEVVDQQTIKMAMPPEDTPRLVAALVEAGAEVYQVTPHHASLEQLFLELTNDTASATDTIRGQHATNV
ncbi:MAG: ABC transporter ATP-binding protein [Ktedonobacteraceae bacterium]